MGRPKGSPNKPKTPQQLVEFNYEDEAGQSDAPTNRIVEQQRNAQPAVNREEFDYGAAVAENAPINAPQSYSPPGSNVFLVTGRVRMDRVGQEPITAEQVRIVYANNYNEAALKFNNYFISMSSNTERYTVLNISMSEAIR